MDEYRAHHPDDWPFPDEVLAETMAFQMWLLGYRINDLGRIAGRSLRRDLRRLYDTIDEHRDHALLRWWWS